MKDHVISIFTLRLAPENFPEFKALVGKIVAATSKEPGTLMYEYSVNDARTEAHIIERYRADAVVSHIEETFAPYGATFLELVTITSLLVYGNPDAPTRKHLDAFGAVYMSSFDGFTRT